MKPSSTHLTLIALVLIALALCVGGAVALPVSAQGPLPEAYRQVDTWQARPQPRPAGELTAAAGVDVGEDGTVYVVDTAEGVVHALAPDGRGLRTIGRPGREIGELDQPRDVAAGADRLYVTDPGNRRVQVFDALTGRFVAAWPSLGRPWGIAIGGERVFVSDAEAERVIELDRAGSVVATWGQGGSVALPLVRPRGIDVDAAGMVYVADPGAALIFAVGPDRRVRARYERPATHADFVATDVAVDETSIIAIAPRQVYGFFSLSQETLWVPGAYIVGGQGIAFGPGSGYVATVQDGRADFSGVLHYPTRLPFSIDAAVWGDVPAALGTLTGPRRIAADAGGAFLLDARPRIQRWSAAGTPITQLRAENAIDIATAPDGDVFVIEPQAVRRLRADGAPVWAWQANTPGTWFVAASAGPSGLRLVDAGNQALVTLPADGPPPAGGSPPQPLAGLIADVAAGGSRWLVADRATGMLRLFDAGGETRWPFPGRVTRVAGAPDGGAWFALTADGWVWKYAPDGSLRAAWDGAPEGAPIDLDVDASGRVLVADGSGDRVFVYAPDDGAPRPVPPAAGDRCDLAPDKGAAPAAVQAGEPVTVTLRVTGDCPSEGIDVDVMLVLDRSSSMAGAKFTAARAAAVAFTTEMDFRRARVGLATFSDAASLDQGLTADAAEIVRALAASEASGSTAIGAALREARTELTGPRARAGAQKALILLSDGLPQQPGPARDEAALAREAGIAVHVIGLGGDLDPTLLAELAGAPERVFVAPTQAELAQVFTRIARRLIATTLVRRLDLVDVVPANMAYVGGSAVPPAAWDGTALRWSLTDVSPAGLVLRYQLRPRQAGRWPTNVLATADYTDGVGFTGRLTFPVPYVSVAGNHAAFLPFLFQNRCAEQRSDIVLVIDTSSSMRESAGAGGPTKLDAARAAAASFIGYLRLPADQAAVVAFSTEARLVQGLTGDRAAIAGALDRLPPAAGTRIDRGLAAAAGEIGGPRRRAGNLPVVVLLTDGQPAEGTAPDVLAQARAMRSAGTFIFAIGLGADADGGLLVDVAGAAGRYIYAPDQTALERTYRTIAWSLPCGGER